jgi:hypothetical protein
VSYCVTFMVTAFPLDPQSTSHFSNRNSGTLRFDSTDFSASLLFLPLWSPFRQSRVRIKRSMHYATSRKVANSIPDFIDLILSAALWLWRRLSLQQIWVSGSFLGVNGGRRVRLTTLPPSVNRLSRENMGASTSHKPMGFHGLLQE